MSSISAVTSLPFDGVFSVSIDLYSRNGLKKDKDEILKWVFRWDQGWLLRRWLWLASCWNVAYWSSLVLRRFCQSNYLWVWLFFFFFYINHGEIGQTFGWFNQLKISFICIDLFQRERVRYLRKNWILTINKWKK